MSLHGRRSGEFKDSSGAVSHANGAEYLAVSLRERNEVKMGFAYRLSISNQHDRLGKSVDTTVFLELAFIEDSWQSFLLGYRLEFSPALASLEIIYSAAPLVVLSKRWGSSPCRCSPDDWNTR